jgi:hypothetical protein
MRKLFSGLIYGDALVNRLLRLATVIGGVFAGLQLADRFFPGRLPSGPVGVALFALTVASGYLGLELINLHRDLHLAIPSTTGDPRSDFADSLVIYASTLANSTPPRDQALLELRRWSSRLLHLNGSHRQRTEIGHLALGAAASLNDRFAEASILIDDLGWSVYSQGLTLEAEASVAEGISILDSLPESEHEKPEVKELHIKGRRHLTTLHFVTSRDIQEVQDSVASLLPTAEELPEPASSLNVAQLNHTEAALIHSYLDGEVGPHGRVDPTGQLQTLYSRALDLSAEAERRFGEIGDVERQVKALKLHVELLKHGGPPTRLNAGESRLRRLETIASRQLG